MRRKDYEKTVTARALFWIQINPIYTIEPTPFLQIFEQNKEIEAKVLFQCKIHPEKYICNWHVAITNHREAQKKRPKLSPGTKREAQHKVTSFLQHLVFPSPLWSTFFLWLCWEQSLPTEQLVRGDSYIFWGREANVICSLAGIRTNEKRL